MRRNTGIPVAVIAVLGLIPTSSRADERVEHLRAHLELVEAFQKDGLNDVEWLAGEIARTRSRSGMR